MAEAAVETAPTAAAAGAAAANKNSVERGRERKTAACVPFLSCGMEES